MSRSIHRFIIRLYPKITRQLLPAVYPHLYPSFDKTLLIDTSRESILSRRFRRTTKHHELKGDWKILDLSLGGAYVIPMKDLYQKSRTRFGFFLEAINDRHSNFWGNENGCEKGNECRRDYLTRKHKRGTVFSKTVLSKPILNRIRNFARIA